MWSLAITPLLLRTAAAAVLLGLLSFASAEPSLLSKQQKVGKSGKQAAPDLYSGLVVNQTVTVAGQNFYQHFVASWRDSEISERYTISIHERPSAPWGSQVWIEYAQKRIFQSSLPSSLAHIKALSAQAAEIAQQKVVDVEVERLLFRDLDLGADDI